MDKIKKIFNIKNIPYTFKERRILLLFVVLIALLMLVATPHLLRIPSDFSYSADIVSVDNFYDEVREEYVGQQYSKTKFSYEVISREKNILFIKNIFDVSTLDNKPVFKAEPVYAINRLTGKHVENIGEKERSGYLFAPRGLEKGQSFEYWHVSNNTSSLMEYVDEEYLYGLKVYRYEKVNKDPVDQTEFMGFLPGVPESRGVKLSSELKMWIEPISGYPIKIEDSSLDYYYYDIKTGEKLYQYNKFSNTYSEESVMQHVSFATSAKNEVLLIRLGPIGLLIFFIIFIFLSKQPIYKKSKDFIKTNKLAFIVLVISLFLFWLFFSFVKNNIEDKTLRVFNEQSTEMKRLVLERAGIYENILFGARGLFDASDAVDRDEWKLYVDSLDLFDRYPGIQALGFTKWIQPNEKDSLVEEVRSDGYPNFDIRPSGERDIYTSIIFIEPFDARNIRAFGFDMFSEEIRRRAMVRARDNAELAASGKVTLVQETEKDTQSGFLLYLPVYKNGITPESVSSRKQNITGYVYSPIRMGDFMSGIFGLNRYLLDLHIYDGLKIEDKNKMFDLEDGDQVDNRKSEDVLFKKIDTIYIAGEPFTLEFINLKSYELSLLDKILPYVILLFGIIFSGLIFFVIYSNTEGRRKAVQDFEKANLKLREKVVQLNNTKKAIINVLEDIEVEKNNYKNVSKRLSLATTSAHIGVWEWDVLKNTLTWDDQMYALYGIKKEDFGGAYDVLQKGLHPEDKKSGDEAIQAALKGKKDFSPQFRVVWPSGEIRHVQAYAIVERDSAGKPLKMVGVNWDITKESIVDRQKSEFVSLASHQLKTPIGSILWDLEMLMDGDYGPVSDKQKDILNEAYTMSKRMNDLVNALLNISRIEMGVFIIEPKPIDFAKLCKEVIKEMEPRLLKKKHKLVKDFDKKLAQIPADDKLLRIVYQNFISNAIKYTPDKGKIKVLIKVDDANITFSVSNNGEPIPEADQSRIFSKMFRASNAQKQDPDGNGLGLYVVKEIVENAGGRVWFTSKKGEDTIFTCSFPLSGMLAKTGTKALT